MKRLLASFGAGLLFGLGLIVSAMVNPAKVIGFLDVFGDWDPSLALVMGGALLVTALGYRFVLKRPSPLFDDSFRLPTRHDIDGRLIGGAALFGIGWGLLGLCPGPVFAALPGAHSIVLVFAAAMLGSMVAWQAVSRSRARPPADR